MSTLRVERDYDAPAVDGNQAGTPLIQRYRLVLLFGQLSRSLNNTRVVSREKVNA